MKNIQAKVSKEAHKNLVDFKLDNNLKNFNEALDKILLLMKGGMKKNE